MLHVAYDAFSEKTCKLGEYLKDFDSNEKEIKKIIDDIPLYWVSPESEAFYKRFKKEKKNKDSVKELAVEMYSRMKELCDAFDKVVDARERIITNLCIRRPASLRRTEMRKYLRRKFFVFMRRFSAMIWIFL